MRKPRSISLVLILAFLMVVVFPNVALANFYAVTRSKGQPITGVNFWMTTPNVFHTVTNNTNSWGRNFIDIEEWIDFTPDVHNFMEFGITDGNIETSPGSGVYENYNGFMSCLMLNEATPNEFYREYKLGGNINGTHNYKIVQEYPGSWVAVLDDSTIMIRQILSYTSAVYADIGAEDTMGWAVFTNPATTTDGRIRDIYGGWYKIWNIEPYPNMVTNTTVINLSYGADYSETNYWHR